MNKPTIFTAINDARALSEMLYELDGDVSDEQISEYVNQLASEITNGVKSKIDGYDGIIDAIEAQINVLKARESRLYNNRKNLETAMKRLKERLIWAITQLGQTMLAGDESILRLQSSPPSVVILDESKIPAKYTREVVTVSVDKMAIKEALLAGEVIEGVSLERGLTLKSKLKLLTKENK